MDSTRRAIAAKERERQKGLTLFELLGVLIILGIVAAIAAPAIAGVLRDAEENADLRMMENVGQVVTNFMMARDQNGDCLNDSSNATINVTSHIACYTTYVNFGTKIAQKNASADGQHKFAWISTQYLLDNGYFNTKPFYRLEDKSVESVLAIYLQAPDDINGRWVVPDLSLNKIATVGTYTCKNTTVTPTSYARTYHSNKGLTSFTGTITATTDVCPA